MINRNNVFDISLEFSLLIKPLVCCIDVLSTDVAVYQRYTFSAGRFWR